MSERDTYPAGVTCWVETLQRDPGGGVVARGQRDEADGRIRMGRGARRIPAAGVWETRFDVAADGRKRRKATTATVAVTFTPVGGSAVTVSRRIKLR